MAEWFRALDLKSGGPWFKSSTLLLCIWICSRWSRVQVQDRIVLIANWSASHQLGFLVAYAIFEIFSYLFTVSPISTAVLNTYDT